MNQKQAIALAIGLILGIGIVTYHWPRPAPRLVSSRTKAGGEIVTDYKAPPNLVPPLAFAAVVVATGLSVYGLRRR